MPTQAQSFPFASAIKAVLLLLLAFAQPLAGQTDVEAEIDALQQRLRSEHYVPVNPLLVTPLRENLNTDGSFSDIDYNVNKLDAFETHLERVVLFANASAGGRLSGDEAFYADMVKALDFWLTEDYRDPNWWWTYIGFPGRLIPVTTLLAERLRPSHPEVYAKLIGYHTRVYQYSQSNPHGGGANLSDMGYRALVGAIMDRNVEQMERVISGSFERAIRLLGRADSWDGWRPDGTMYGHGAQLHNATYGREMALSASSAVELLHGSPWDLGDEMLGLIEDQLINGVMRMSYGSWFDFNAAGRAVSRQSGGALANGYSGIIETVLGLDPEQPEKLQALLDRIRNGPSPDQNISGTKSFYFSDFMSHLRDDYYTSVRMISNRTKRNEMLNGEGLKNLYFGDGIQFTLVHGDEYASLPPVWNYSRLPGLTARQLANPRPQTSFGERGSASFANSVTDGWTGVAAMRLQHVGMTGWKSWFLLDEGVVALGTGISAASPDFTEDVLTTLNQTRYAGDIVVGNEDGSEETLQLPATRTGTDMDWFWHRDVGYLLFGDNDPVTMAAATQTGNWSSIGTSSGSAAIDVFTLYLDHGVRPIGKSYAYMVLPAATAGETRELAETPPVEILRQDGWVHSIRHTGTGAIYAAFLGEATLDIGDGRSIAAEEALLLQLVPRFGEWHLSVSDPEFNRTSASVELVGFDLAGEPDPAMMDIALPQGDALGSRAAARYKMNSRGPYVLGTETNIGPGWFRSEGFGPYAPVEGAWIHHLSLGWVYLLSDSPESLYLFDASRGGWYWMRHDIPGIAFEFATASWVDLD